MPLVVGLHYTLAFALELVLLFGLGLFGFVRGGGGWTGAGLAAVFVVGAVLLWARFAAPKSATRLEGAWLLMFKVAIFAAGAWAIWGAGQTGFAMAFGLVAAGDIAVAVALRRL